ncbi:hypothetical protein B0H14DRAFT_3503205 [Mycena olivaceomarginata]|nr:hypothetical protein B0H14DRAFT_3503205 [Mycena olivaceomarginata]
MRVDRLRHYFGYQYPVSTVTEPLYKLISVFYRSPVVSLIDRLQPYFEYELHPPAMTAWLYKIFSALVFILGWFHPTFLTGCLTGWGRDLMFFFDGFCLISAISSLIYNRVGPGGWQATVSLTSLSSYQQPPARMRKRKSNASYSRKRIGKRHTHSPSSSDTTCIAVTIGRNNGDRIQLEEVITLTDAPEYWPVPPAEHRIAYLVDIRDMPECLKARGKTTRGKVLKVDGYIKKQVISYSSTMMSREIFGTGKHT